MKSDNHYLRKISELTKPGEEEEANGDEVE